VHLGSAKKDWELRAALPLRK
jgi:hypothetical protein